MQSSEAGRGARHDQVRAAQADVVAILGAIARERARWSRIDEGMQSRIEALLEWLFAADAAEGRICPHARQATFDRAPRPLVLDAVRGILACWDGCYWRAVRSWLRFRRGPAVCLSCGRGMATYEGGPDMFIAYGPILVVGALCQECRGTTPTGSTSASRGDA